MRRAGELAGVVRQLFGWAALPALAVLLLLCLAVLLRQAAGRFGLGQTIPWGQLGEMLAGLGIVFLAVLGLSHLWGAGVDPLSEAMAGQGGGLVGWLIGSLPGALLGDLVTTILLIVLAGLGGWIAVRSVGMVSPDWRHSSCEARCNRCCPTKSPPRTSCRPTNRRKRLGLKLRRRPGAARRQSWSARRSR